GHAGSGADWGALTRAMQVLGVGESEQEGIIKVLAAVLHLGNVYFHRRQLRHGQEGVEIGSDVEIKWAAHLLQISANGLQRALTTRITEARAERVHSPLSIDQALDARDAFAKALYSALFNWLVTRVNSIVQRGGLHDAARISLLDIFGFENLAENSFEQLCINFASESLQLYFNKHVFKLEQQEYARERLEWTNLTWMDNTPVIHLLGKKPVGILHLLDDESNFPKASDSSFLEKCHYNHALNENYCRPRVGGREFGIRHFAGQVWYSVDGFLDKNRDALRPEIVELLASSKEPLVCAIAKPLLTQAQTKTLPRGTNGRFVTMKPRTPTVAARFSDSLQQLLESMTKCNPWFVRCIKPNSDKTPMRFDMPVVLEQLRYSGMLDTIRIRQSGYPVRMKFQYFVERYRYLYPGKLPRGVPYRDLCRGILEQRPINLTAGPDYQLGATRVFLREGLERQLEIARADCLRDSALVIQKHMRGYLARKNYRQKKRAAIILQKHWRGYKQRSDYSILKKGITRVQALYRGKLERKRYAAKKAELKRRLEAERLAQERAKQRAAREKAESQRVQRSTVHHLEIPAELAFIFSKLEGYTPPHTERNLVKVVGGISGHPPNPNLPSDLHQYEFTKFTSVYFKGADLGLKREPISTPFLSKAAARDQDFQDAIALFKLILRWSNDAQLAGPRERALADYVVHKGLNSRSLRDELFVQLVNQSWRNDNTVRMKFQYFVERYRYLYPGKLPRGVPYRDLCRGILEQRPINLTAGPDYQLGATRVFLREGLERQLEIARADCLRDSALVIQKHMRGYLARKNYRQKKRAAIILQKHWRGYKQRSDYSILKKGITRVQALYRGKLERKRYAAKKAELKRRLEAERLAQERAKQRAAREKAESQRVQRSTVHHLEIPAELAFIFSKLEGYTPPHTERNLVKVVGGISGHPPNPNLPSDLHQYEFTKFTSVYFKGADLGLKREPISTPFLSKAAARDQDFQDAIALFKLILRWSNDTQLAGPRERALADYVVHKGLNSRSLRDELFVQLVNQSWRNDNTERIWQMMSHCLSCFQPSPALNRYLLKYVTDHSPTVYKEMLQRKLLRGVQKAPHSRALPPSLLEWRATRQKSNMALPLTMADGNVSTVSVDSWTTCEEAASIAVSSFEISLV
ncbi:Myosin head, partial [Oryctes borbonicus]